MIRVLIGDHHGVVREGLKEILSGTGDITVVAEASTESELFEKLRSEKVNVIVFDWALSEARPFDILLRLRRDRPDIPLLIFTTLSEQELGARALKAGAAGYLMKDGEPNDVVAAIKRIAIGGKYITPTLAESLADGLSEIDRPPHTALTEREYTIFKLFAAGWKNVEIAESLGLSIKTVGSYRTRILSKLRVATTAGLIHYAMLHGLL